MDNNKLIRQVVIDIETTGIEPAKNHRVIEIAAVELVDRHITGRFFHSYLNPGRTIDQGAEDVHGITLSSLQDKPRFEDIAHQLTDFINGAELIVHNAPFHIDFLNREFARLKLDSLDNFSSRITDTFQLAKLLRPDKNNSLNVLCEDLEIEWSNMDLAGSLLDANLLARVYLKLSQHRLH